METETPNPAQCSRCETVDTLFAAPADWRHVYTGLCAFCYGVEIGVIPEHACPWDRHTIGAPHCTVCDWASEGIGEAEKVA